MMDETTRKYFDFLQSNRDREDEDVQRAQRAKETERKKFRLLTRVVTHLASLPREQAAAFWKEHCAALPGWKPITDFLFSGSD